MKQSLLVFSLLGFSILLYQNCGGSGLKGQTATSASYDYEIAVIGSEGEDFQYQIQSISELPAGLELQAVENASGQPLDSFQGNTFRVEDLNIDQAGTYILTTTGGDRIRLNLGVDSEDNSNDSEGDDSSSPEDNSGSQDDRNVVQNPGSGDPTNPPPQPPRNQRAGCLVGKLEHPHWNQGGLLKDHGDKHKQLYKSTVSENKVLLYKKQGTGAGCMPHGNDCEEIEYRAYLGVTNHHREMECIDGQWTPTGREDTDGLGGGIVTMNETTFNSYESRYVAYKSLVHHRLQQALNNNVHTKLLYRGPDKSCSSSCDFLADDDNGTFFMDYQYNACVSAMFCASGGRDRGFTRTGRHLTTTSCQAQSSRSEILSLMFENFNECRGLSSSDFSAWK